MTTQTIQTWLMSNHILTDEESNKIEYLKTTGRDIVESIMLLKFPSRNLIIDGTQAENIQTLVNTVFNMHSYNWTKKYSTINFEYEPLDDEDYSNIHNEKNSGSDTIGNKTSNSGTDTNNVVSENSGNTVDTKSDNDTTSQTTSKNAYDDSALTITDKVDTTLTNGTVDTFADNLHNTTSGTNTFGHVVDVNGKNEYGRIVDATDHVKGRTRPAQELIQMEREVAEYNFYEMIADEVCYFITYGIYDL